MKPDQHEAEDDDRPPICPAGDVTMGIRDDGAATRYVCLECGFDGGGET